MNSKHDVAVDSESDFLVSAPVGVDDDEPSSIPMRLVDLLYASPTVSAHGVATDASSYQVKPTLFIIRPSLAMTSWLALALLAVFISPLSNH
jgi:hypothetical protein